MNNNDVVILGASGHGKVVLSTLLANHINVLGFLDDDPSRPSLNGFKVLGPIRDVTSYQHAIMAIGHNQHRQMLAKQFPNVQWQTYIHPTAYVHPSVKLGAGSIVFAHAVIQPDAMIGNHCIINTGVTVDHDCTLGDYVHLAPGVHLAGDVHIGEGVFMGIGSVAIPGIHIGAWSVVGAGGVVVRDIGSRQTAVGIPAKEKVIATC